MLGPSEANLAHLSNTRPAALCHKIKSRMQEFPEAYWAVPEYKVSACFLTAYTSRRYFFGPAPSTSLGGVGAARALTRGH